MTRVYVWPGALGMENANYSDPNLLWVTPRWNLAPGQRVAQAQRSSMTVQSRAFPAEQAALDILLARLHGGTSFCALIDVPMRARLGWDTVPALDAAGNEFWRADGKTEQYAGEAATPPTGPWRSVFAQAAGAHAADATSLAVGGLLAGEVLPRGLMIRVGDFRHPLLAEAIADGTGAATLSLANPLEAAVADTDPIRIPGDLFVGWLPDRPRVEATDRRFISRYSMKFVEVYEGEGGESFEWVVD